MNDPFYRQILEVLSGRLDPDVFEEAVGDLLRDALPTLVPIRGGTDFGMDGAVADGDGPAFPLTCTTSKDVIGNLRKSLQSYLAGGGKRRKVVVATSQELSGTKRRNLEKQADKLGFEIVQVFDRAAIAHRLYRNGAWCRQLLGITGSPSALSVIPESSRPLFGGSLIGRDDDIGWLQKQPGDALLVGQPGSGKTSILHSLAIKEWGLFIVDSDPAAIAEAIRTQKPKVVIVDDAHVRLDFLNRLRQIRSELSATFSIVSSCWPGEANLVAEAMNLTAAQRRTLELLTRDEIVDVVKASGIKGPNHLIRRIVDQAEGRPGLAVTLANLCVRGDYSDVVLGEALKRSWTTVLEELIGQRATQILAALSIGGDTGMAIEDVAEGLQITPADVQRDVVQLAAAGVVLQVGDNLSVRPAVLRWLLARDVFFSGALSLPVQPLLDRSQNLEETAIVLIGARGYRGDVSDGLLLDVLEDADSEKAWSLYSSLGPNEAKESLARHPDLAIPIARHALNNVPDVILPLLLRESVDDERALHSHVEHPLRLIEDWIKKGAGMGGDPIARRRSLLQNVKRWLADGGCRRVGLKALSFVVLPSAEFHENDPGSGNTFSFSSWLLTPESLREISAIWPDVRGIIANIVGDDWESVLDIVHKWTYPESLVFGREVPASYDSVIRPIAQTIIQDLASIASGRPGIIHRLHEYAKVVGICLSPTLPSDFETLFPKRSPSDWREQDARYNEAIRRLAEVWKNQSPVSIATTLASYHREAGKAGLHWPSGTQDVCRLLSKSVDEPLAWFRALRDADAASELLEPFLKSIVERRDEGWVVHIQECIRNTKYRRLGVIQALCQDASQELVVEAIELDGTCEEVAHILRLSGQVPMANLKLLLRHRSSRVATEIAFGEWFADPKGVVRPELEADWKSAILRAEMDETQIPEILKDNPALAEEWLNEHFRTGKNILRWGICKTITKGLDVAARRRLLSAMEISYRTRRIAKALIGKDVELYREVLSDQRYKLVHLAPLYGMKPSNWNELATAALDFGYSPEEVAEAAFGTEHNWSGNESDFMQTWIDRFRPLTESDDVRLKEVAAIGIVDFEKRRDAARVRERKEAIYGHD